MNIIKTEDTEIVSGRSGWIQSEEDNTDAYLDAKYERQQEEFRNYEENYREMKGETERDWES